MEKNPVHTYHIPGTYSVSLNATNSGGYNSTQKTGYINVISGVTYGPIHNLNTGLNYTSIQGAINAATTGDTAQSKAVPTSKMSISRSRLYLSGWIPAAVSRLLTVRMRMCRSLCQKTEYNWMDLSLRILLMGMG